MFDRRDSDDLDRYFVCPVRPIQVGDELTGCLSSTARETSTSTQNGPLCFVCTAVSCRN
jgi:hypothetical protein